MPRATKAAKRGARKTTRVTRTVTKRATKSARPVKRAPAKRAPISARTTTVAPGVSIMHQIGVGKHLLWNVEGHAARTDSPQFKLARTTMHEILKTVNPNPYDSGDDHNDVEAHHGGSIWVYTDDGQWRLVLNWAGIEWAAQFCCDPAKVDRLRQNALAITSAFKNTLPQLKKLGYTDTSILTTQITTPDDVAHYVDSIWNSCVPIPKLEHVGSLSPDHPLASGVHEYPEPACGIPRVMRSDFVPFVVDKRSGAAAMVAPVAPHGSGDGRVRLLYAERGHPLHDAHQQAHDAGGALIVDATHPIAKSAFVNQQ